VKLFFGTRQKQYLFILAEPRSGSTWLTETLNSHPQVRLLGELLNPKLFPEVAVFPGLNRERLSEPLQYLDRKLKKTGVRYPGCKILLNHLNQISPDFLGLILATYPTAHYLFLTRKNLVKSLVSVKIAEQSDRWHLHPGEEHPLTPIHIDPAWLKDRLKQRQLLRTRMASQLAASGCRQMKIAYEDLFDNREDTIRQISKFLHLPGQDIRFSRKIKSTPTNLEKIIANYADVCRALQEEPEYYSMLTSQHL